MSVRISWSVVDGRINKPAGQIVLSRAARLSVGRVAGNDIVVAHPSVSRQHAQIIYDNRSVKIQDLGSTNGIHIDGTATKGGVWRPGQRVRIGAYRFDLEPAASVLTGPFRPLYERARIVVILLSVIALLYVFRLAYDIWHAAYLSGDSLAFFKYLGLLPVDHLSREVRGVATFARYLALFVHLAFTATFLLWLYRAAWNLRAFDIDDLNFSPEMGVVWWVIPVPAMIVAGLFLSFAAVSTTMLIVALVVAIIMVIVSLVSFVQVFRVLSEVWRASTPGLVRNQWRHLPTPKVIVFWWLSMLLVPLVLVVGIASLTVSAQTSWIYALNAFPVAVILTILFDLCLVAGTLLLIKTVNRISDMQHASLESAKPQATQVY